MADAAPVMIWRSGTDKLCDFFNQRWLDFTGRTMEQELGNGWSEGVHPDDLDRCMKTYVDAFDNREKFGMEYQLKRNDGEYRWIFDTGVPRYAPDGSFTGYIGSCVDITEHKQAEETLRVLSGRLISGQEMERRRIARELHDDVSQNLALVAVELERLGRERLSPAALSGRVAQILVRLKEASSGVHALSHQLHPAKLEHLGLAAALRGLCRDLWQHGLVVGFTDRDVRRGLPQEVALGLYRIAQEALHNVVKHSGATRAEVELIGEPGALVLRVADGGKGFDPGTPGEKQGLGLISMRERVRLLGGTMTLRSAPGLGTSLEARVPLSGDTLPRREEKRDDARAAG
jgi:PAS domain S-box-containing protein